MVNVVLRLPHDFVLFVLKRIVENADSTGLVVRMCGQCSAG